MLNKSIEGDNLMIYKFDSKPLLDKLFTGKEGYKIAKIIWIIVLSVLFIFVIKFRLTSPLSFICFAILLIITFSIAEMKLDIKEEQDVINNMNTSHNLTGTLVNLAYVNNDTDTQITIVDNNIPSIVTVYDVKLVMVIDKKYKISFVKSGEVFSIIEV